MKEKILSNITAVISALNMVTVSGKQNLNTMVGSISVLEDIYKELLRADITEQATEQEAP